MTMTSPAPWRIGHLSEVCPGYCDIDDADGMFVLHCRIELAGRIIDAVNAHAAKVNQCSRCGIKWAEGDDPMKHCAWRDQPEAQYLYCPIMKAKPQPQPPGAVPAPGT